MTSTELIKSIFYRLGKFKWLILLSGLAAGIAMYFYAKSQRPVYTAKATVFPLSSSTETNLASNALSGILGLSDGSKSSFSSDAAINIIELALSRFVRESVATTKLPQFQNKTVATLLAEDNNEHAGLGKKEMPVATDSAAMALIGGEMLKPAIAAKMNKNGVLELSFSSTNKALITPVSYVLIDRISQFYIDLKIKKAKADYEFTVRKIDSLDKIISVVNGRSVNLQNTTLFAPDKLEYDLPRERMSADRQRYTRQRDISLNNQEEALWRLQKLTPIISVLDKPTEPFAIARSSGVLYGLGGLFMVSLLVSFIVIAGLLFQYAKSEINKALFKEDVKA